MVSENGDRYKGYWQDDQFDGSGQLRSSSSNYEGQFIEGQKQGLGRERFNNGDFY